MVTRRAFVRGVAAAPVVGSLLFAGVHVRAGEGEPIRIGSKDFTEQLILGELYALLLEDAGFEVERDLNLGGTLVAHEALTSGEIDLYPEYTGTGLTVVLETPVEELEVSATPGAGAEAGRSLDERVYEVVAEGYRDAFDLVWLDQAPFNNTQALAVRRDFAEEHDLETISELAELAPDLTISAPVDFVEREDGLAGLRRVYGDFDFENILAVAPGLKYKALEEGDAEVVLAFGTDGQIFGLDLVVLEDDKGLWPPYHVAPVVRQETLDANPELAATLNQLAPLLTADVMAGLNWQVDGPEKMEPRDVARRFLAENGLLAE